MVVQFIEFIPNKVELREVVSFIWEWFDLVRDLNLFYELAKGDTLLKKTVQEFHGLRVIGVPDLFEALCWGILGQQINLAFAYTLKRRLLKNLESPSNGMVRNIGASLPINRLLN